MKLTKDEARKYGRRGAKARQHQWKYHVEGEYVSTKEIAARAGISESTVKRRIQASTGPLTWQGFGIC